MKTKLTYNEQGKLTFEVVGIKDGIKQWVPIFENEVYLSKMKFPIGDKHFRVVGLGGAVQDAFFKTYNNDMLFVKDENEVKNALEQIIITLGYIHNDVEVIQ
jgi:hypothetical protein